MSGLCRELCIYVYIYIYFVFLFFYIYIYIYVSDCRDELMHYLVCPILWQFPLPHVGMIQSVFIGERLGLRSPSVRQLRALALVHAVYHFCKNDPFCIARFPALSRSGVARDAAIALVQSRAHGFAVTSSFMIK